MLQNYLLGYENDFKWGSRQVDEKLRYIPHGQARADGLLQIANWIMTHSAKLSWRKTVIIICIWKGWMEPAGHVKDDFVTPNICRAFAGVLCRGHETKSVSSIPQSSNQMQRRAAGIQRVTVNMNYSERIKNEIIGIERLREQKGCPEKFWPEKGHYITSCQSWVQQESSVLNIRKRCSRLVVRKKNCNVRKLLNGSLSTSETTGK